MSSPSEDATGAVELTVGDDVLARGRIEPGETYVDLHIEVSDGTDRRTALAAVLSELLGRTGDAPPRWWVTGPDGVTDAVAEEAGLTGRRDLYRLGRPLPLDEAARAGRPSLPTRPIRLGGPDEAAVVDVNNRAFAWHPDQAGRTVDWLRQGAAEPWFDPQGFLVHEHDGRIDGFCWTKVHRDHEPHIGEIYVIAVDPDAHGRGLGRGLTVAGLDHLADRNISESMLYVEAVNVPALALYDRLGFERQAVQRAYQPAAS